MKSAKPKAAATKASVSIEEQTLDLQLNRIMDHLNRIRDLKKRAGVVKKMRFKLIAEELHLLAETNKAAMRLVLDHLS